MKAVISSQGAACSILVGSSALCAWPLILFTSIRRRPLIDVSCSSSSSSIGIPALHREKKQPQCAWCAGQLSLFLFLSNLKFLCFFCAGEAAIRSAAPRKGGRFNYLSKHQDVREIAEAANVQIFCLGRKRCRERGRNISWSTGTILLMATQRQLTVPRNMCT